MDEKKTNNKKRLLVVGLILLCAMAVVGVTYAWLSITVKGKTTQVIQTGDLSLTIEEGNSINLAGALPMYDADGARGKSVYTFTLKNHQTFNLDYTIKLLADTEAQTNCATTLNNGNPCTFISSEYIRYQIIKNQETPVINGLSLNSGIIDQGEIQGNATNSYTLKIWLSSDTPNDYKGAFFLGKLSIEAIQNGKVPDYVDASGASAPDLVEGLIPVLYDGTNWVSADTSEKWYAYEEQWWANAVTTTEANRTKYQTPGTVIPISDINTMWVWIPRYEYKFSNMVTGYAGGTAEQPGAIGINFISQDVTTPSDASNYKVHPAFTFGTDELSGIWAGKFETGNQTACTATGEVADTDCDLTTLGVQVKPNVSSWRGIRISTMFTVSREMSNVGNAYGLNNTTTDSHMMKNTEWGAVAYLSQSKYGKYGNSAYSGVNKDVYINYYWNGDTLTGCSAGAPSTAQADSCAYTYEKPMDGTGASTTGNIYGVYDMSGGGLDYVMGNMKTSDNLGQMSGMQDNNVNSGFTGINYDGTSVSGRAYPESKYYDVYTYGTSGTDLSTRYITGDATYEISQGDGKSTGWYSDYTSFVSTQWPWFYRGGGFNNTTVAGVFFSTCGGGGAGNGSTFRLVLTSNL